MTDSADRPDPQAAMPLTPERWKTLEPIVDAALELAPGHRRAFLAEACHGDARLQAEVELLLSAYDRRDTLLMRPAAERFASLLDDGESLPDVLNGSYRIVRELGRGGMATVYLARDLRRERDVAVKVLHPHVAALLGTERFLSEIRTTARLQHAHVLPLHDSGEAEGFLFFAMPYVEGGSLRRRLEREQQLPVDDAVRIGCEVASALGAAHRRGIIHRDIKPENILLHEGAALVADFGIALVGTDGGARLTQAGATLGTPQYMSPEQATGERTLDARSDVYALGLVVYEMLAGEPPFNGPNAVAILAKRAALPVPSLRVVREGIPPPLDAAVARALAREPADRYRTAGEFAEALQQAVASGLSQHGPGEQRVAAQDGRRGFVAIAGVAITAAILFGISRTDVYRRALPPGDPDKIVVVPFGITNGDASVAYLTEGLAVLLTPMLTGEGGPRAVDSRTAISAWNRVRDGREGTAEVARDVARTVGASKALFGNAVFGSGRLTLTAHLVESGDGESHPLTAVSGPVDSLPSLLDGILRHLLVRLAGVPDHTVGELTSQSLPALRAYLDGRAAYRRTQHPVAMQLFNQALDVDSTFALAALDLAMASGKLLRQSVCPNNDCSYASTMPGFRDAGSGRDDASFSRGVRLAWESRGKLGPRDLPLLDALRGKQYPLPSDAKETLAGLERAAAAAPDRADTKFLLGLVMLNQGKEIGISDELTRAEALFHDACRLDSAYLAPRARLVDVAALQKDSAKLRRFGAHYLARDSISATADYVRWRVAVGTADHVMLRAIVARFDSLDLATLKQIVTASQTSGIGLDDADRAAAIVIARTTDPLERNNVLFQGNVLALNRGRPRLADSLLRLRREVDTSQFSYWRSTTLAALYTDGDAATGESSARERVRWLARDTLPNTVQPRNYMVEVSQQSVWDWAHGRLREAQALTSWLRSHSDTARRDVFARLVDVTEMLIATSLHRSDAPTLRARIDAESRRGCCKAPHTLNLSLASAYELSGDYTAALSALRRGQGHGPMFLSTYLLREARVAARVGDRAGAIRAYEHYLALRAEPEPALRPQRDSIRAELDLVRASAR